MNYRTVGHYYILVIRKFIDFMSLFRHIVWSSFLLNNIPLQSLEYATYNFVLLTRTAVELNYPAVYLLPIDLNLSPVIVISFITSIIF